MACRDAEGRFDGPVEMIAPDGSILLQGYCQHGVRLGPWITWRRGRVVGVEASDERGFARGLRLGDPESDRDVYEGVPVTTVTR